MAWTFCSAEVNQGILYSNELAQPLSRVDVRWAPVVLGGPPPPAGAPGANVGHIPIPGSAGTRGVVWANLLLCTGPSLLLLSPIGRSPRVLPDMLAPVDYALRLMRPNESAPLQHGMILVMLDGGTVVRSVTYVLGESPEAQVQELMERAAGYFPYLVLFLRCFRLPAWVPNDAVLEEYRRTRQTRMYHVQGETTPPRATVVKRARIASPVEDGAAGPRGGRGGKRLKELKELKELQELQELNASKEAEAALEAAATLAGVRTGERLKELNESAAAALEAAATLAGGGAKASSPADAALAVAGAVTAALAQAVTGAPLETAGGPPGAAAPPEATGATAPPGAASASPTRGGSPCSGS